MWLAGLENLAALIGRPQALGRGQHRRDFSIAQDHLHRLIFGAILPDRSLLDVLAAHCGQATPLLARLPRAGEDAIISQIKAAKASELRR